MNIFGFGKAKEKRSRYYDAPVPMPSHNPINNAITVTTASEMTDWMFNGISSAGVSVTEKTAMAVSAVYACVALIGGGIASMPIGVYERIGETDRTPITPDIWWLLNEQPNAEYSSATLWECLMQSKLLHGDAFALLIRKNTRSDNIIGIEWYASPRVTVKRINNELVYTMVDLAGNIKTYGAMDVLHFPGPGFNGLRGMSQLQFALKQSAGIAIAADTHSSKFFENGARPDFAIVHPGNPTTDQAQVLRETWAERHSGVKNSHLPAVLAGGMDIKELTMNAEDAQLLSTRQFQVEDIARIFGVPPHMIGLTSASTSWGSGIEQMSLGFVKWTLMRHMTTIEKELNRKIWPNNKQFFAEFNPSALERGDYQTRMNGYRVGIGRAGEPGFYTVNEVRKFENMPPIEGGDILFTGAPNAQPTAQTPGL